MVIYFCPKCGKPLPEKELQKNRFCGSCGKFLTNNDRRLMEQNKTDDNDISSQPTASLNIRVEKLLEFAKKVNAEELVPVLEKEAAEVITDPFGFAQVAVGAFVAFNGSWYIALRVTCQGRVTFWTVCFRQGVSRKKNVKFATRPWDVDGL